MIYNDPAPDILAELPALDGARSYPAAAKLRLVHRLGASVVFPEMIFCLSGNRFIAPTDFSPCSLGFLDSDSTLTIPFRVKGAEQFYFRTTISQHIRALDDGSHLYRGELAGPKPITPWLTGQSRWVAQRQSFDARLFHHTSAPIRQQIRESGYLRGSTWNYQGTRRLTNVAYAYLTSRARIRSDDDLVAIGMASDGRIGLRCDDGPDGYGQPVFFDVYRESALNRRAALAFWTPIEILAAPHIIAHRPPNEPAWYEISTREIFRIPLKPDAVVDISPDGLAPSKEALRVLGYSIIADATHPDNIGACLDEEGTDDIFKFESAPDAEIIAFWKENQNVDHFSDKAVDAFQFTHDFRT
jgi:hypothetical protein